MRLEARAASVGLRLALAVMAAAPLAAQPRASFRGTVADSATGHPVRRATVMLGADRSARADSLGRFAFDSVAPGRYHLSVRCTAPVPLIARRLWDEEVEIAAGQERRALTVDARDCDQRPFLAVVGDFRGFYEAGFEHLRFVPCPGRAAGLPPSLSEARDSATWVWVWSGPHATPRPLPAWEYRSGVRRWYVHWRGTIRGPDSYGHFGVGAYEATVDTFLTMRRPGGSDCG